MKQTKEIKQISKETMDIVIGLMIVLLSLIAFLLPIAKKTRDSMYFVLKVFGVIGFWAFFLGTFLFGIFLMFRKKLFKWRFDFSLLGLFLSIFVFFPLVTYAFTPESLTFNYQNVKSFINLNLTNETLLSYKANAGGGLLGFYFVATLNYLTPVVGIIINAFLFLFGFLIIFRRSIQKLFHSLKVKRQEAKTEKKYYDNVALKSETETTASFSLFNETPHIDKDDDFTLKTLPQISVDDEVTSPFDNVSQIDQGLKRPKNIFNTEDEAFRRLLKEEKKDDKVILKEVPKEEKKVEVSVVQEVIETKTIHEEIKPQFKETIIEKEVVKVEPKIKEDKYVRAPFIYPTLELLNYHESPQTLEKNEETTKARLNMLNNIFEDLNIGATAVSYTIGPSVTRFDIQMEPNTSVSTINRYIDDLSSRLGGIRARFEPIVTGKTTSGLEIQNDFRSNVGLKEALEIMPSGGRLSRDLPLGKNISGDLVYANIDDLPHMLIAGTTGSGKSVFVHSLIMTLIMRNHPDDLKLMIIDPKRVELAHYEDVPHLLCPLITDMSKAKVAFNKLVDEMENRYILFQENRVSKISQYNDLMKTEKKAPLPYIIVFVDEFADLSDTVRDIHEPVVRIAQKARAAGIHLFISTQRPTTDVIKPRIKTNLPAHVALMMSNFTDSTTIIGRQGAEKLLGNGDMLIEIPIISRTSIPRLQGCFVNIDEISNVVAYLKDQIEVQYDPNFLDLEEKVDEYIEFGEGASQTSSKELLEEELYKQIAVDMIDRGYISISFIQRTYGVGFPRAGRLFTRLQKEGLVSLTSDSHKGCKVLITSVDQIPDFN